MGILERGRCVSLFIGDVIVLVWFWDNDNVVFISTGSGNDWKSCLVVIKSLGNGVWMLRDWYFLSTILLPDLLRSGENYRVKEKKE
jgi:hypothetical protein